MTQEMLNKIFSRHGISLLREIGNDVYLIRHAEKPDEKQVLKVIDINQKAGEVADETYSEDFVRQWLGVLHGNELIWNEKITLTQCEYLMRILGEYIVGGPEEDIFLYAIRMPYYQTLHMMLVEGGIAENEVINLGIDICNALRTLHHDGTQEFFQNETVKFGTTLHLDIKPDNIFCDKKDDLNTYMLGDFGTLIEKGNPVRPMRTKGYYAPEVEDCEYIPTEAADVFSLGMVLYRCVCNSETELDAFWQSRFTEAEVTMPKDCSPHLWNVILRATKRAPEERYQSAAEFQAALGRINTNKAIVAELMKERAEGDEVVRLAMSFLEAAVLVNGLFQKVKKVSGKTQQLDFGRFGMYEGGTKNGNPHGKGKCTYTYGKETISIFGTWEWVKKKRMKRDGVKVIYTGMLCDGKICGLGECKIPKAGTFLGITYDGAFQTGTMQWENGDSYFGTWAGKDGCDWMHGEGTYCYADGTVKTGQWEYGEFVE